MKYFVLILLLMLAGCSAQPVYETVQDELVQPVSAQPKQIHVDLAEEPVLPAMESDGGTLYLCGDYDVMIHTLPSGDLNRTVEQVSGFAPEDLTILHTASGELERYEFVWTSAVDGGEQISRATILDDGDYHYVLSATVGAELIEEYQEIWNGIFESFYLESY